MPPLTTVLMPAHNAEATIRESVASALGQSVENIEVIVVDDGSRIPVASVLADIRDSRLRIVRHERNRGVSAARNTAVSLARSPLLSQLDADDLWEPSYIESILPMFDDPGVGLAYCDARVLGRSKAVGAYLPDQAADDGWIADPGEHPVDSFPDLCRWCPICSPTVTARTEAVRAVGGYAEWLPAGSDWHLYLKLAKAGWRFSYLDERLSLYRWPEAKRGMSYDLARRELMDLRLWLGFNVRHPGTPGAGRSLLRCLRRIATRRAPRLKHVYVSGRAVVRRAAHRDTPA